jgi:putative FmdB family regulatory protein
MPTYVFTCKACGERFEKNMSLTERETTKVSCPKCGGGEVERVYSSFFAKTSRKA